MPRGGRGGRGGHHHHHHHHGGWRGRPGPGPIFGGPFFGGPPPPGPFRPPPGPGPIVGAVGAAAAGAAIVGGAVYAENQAERRRRERQEAERQRQLRLEEERQIERAKQQSLQESELQQQQRQIDEQQRQIQQQMAQLNMMNQQKQQQQQQQQIQQNTQQNQESWNYYGGASANANVNANTNNSNSSLSEMEGQPGSNSNSNNNNTFNYNQNSQNANFNYYGNASSSSASSQQPQPQPQQQQQAKQQSSYQQNQQQYQQQYQAPPPTYQSPQQQTQQQTQQAPPSYQQQSGSVNFNYNAVPPPTGYQQPPQQQQQQQGLNSSMSSASAPSAPPASDVIAYPDLSALKKGNAAKVEPSAQGQAPPPSYVNFVANQQESQAQAQAQRGSFVQAPISPMSGGNGNEDEKNEGIASPRNGDILATIRAKQPFSDARPTLVGLDNYDDNMAMHDAKELRKAMKGFGTKEGPIIKISGTRNLGQRLKILEQYVNVDGHGKHRDLIKDLKSELGGNLKDVILALYMRPGEYDAHMVEEACAGAGYNETLLIEILCTRTNDEIRNMKYAWDHFAKKKHKVSLKERIHKETSKLFSVGNFQTLMDSIIDCKRDESRGVDNAATRQDAELLNRVIQQEKKKEAKAKFVEVFSTRSWAHIRQLARDFGEISKKYTLVAAIARTFGECATSQAMRVILEYVQQPYDFWAKRLLVAMKGIGTNDNLLKRVILSRCEIDLYNVSEVFGQRYGNGKTLGKWLKDDTGGHYKEILLYLTNYHS